MAPGACRRAARHQEPAGAPRRSSPPAPSPCGRPLPWRASHPARATRQAPPPWRGPCSPRPASTSTHGAVHAARSTHSAEVAGRAARAAVRGVCVDTASLGPRRPGRLLPLSPLSAPARSRADPWRMRSLAHWLRTPAFAASGILAATGAGGAAPRADTPPPAAPRGGGMAWRWHVVVAPSTTACRQTRSDVGCSCGSVVSGPLLPQLL